MKARFSPALAVVLVISCLAPAQTAQTTFEFHSGIWFNLHHTLYNQSVAKKSGRLPDLSVLFPPEVGVWNQALDFYGRSLVNHDLLELSMTRLSQTVAGAGNTSDLQAPGLSKEMESILEAAAPIYKARWWPEHDKSNRDWIDSITPLVAAHEGAMRPALSAAYDTPWPKGPVRVEVSYFVAGNSAYTAIDPTLITVSSRSERNQGAGGLETLFHEEGHALVQKVFAEIAKEEKSQKKNLKNRDLWHALVFYTTAELLRKRLPALEPYAVKYGLWENSWPEILPLMEKDWKPFLDGKAKLKDAIKQLVSDAPAR
jgi:hypothetical protein